MKKIIASSIILGLFVFLVSFIPPFSSMRFNSLEPDEVNQDNIKGAWRMIGTDATGSSSEMTVVKIITDTYYTNASYSKEKREFAGTSGGNYSIEKGTLTERVEFDTWDSTQVGTANTSNFQLKNNRLEISGERDGQTYKETWERIDEFNPKASSLAGVWRIRERQTEPGSMSIMEWGPRKTLKILSNNRFQWIAFNVETKQFSGTGGGTYTAKGGKYTENLEFFSRDPKRVGASLTFDFEIKENRWHHKGKSSTGNDIYEIWENVD